MIFITVDILKTHCQKNKKIKRADQILPEVHGITLSKKPFRPLYIFKHVLKSNFVLFIWKNIAGYPTKVLLADVELLQYDMVIGFYRVVLITWLK